MTAYIIRTTFLTTKVITQLATIPVTNYLCERALAKLFILKSRIRYTMLQERFLSLTFIFIKQKMA